MANLYRILDADKVPEGILTNCVGVHPVLWRDVVNGVITEPTLVTVQDEQAERDMALGQKVREAIATIPYSHASPAHFMDDLACEVSFGADSDMDVAAIIGAIAEALKAEQAEGEGNAPS